MHNLPQERAYILGSQILMHSLCDGAREFKGLRTFRDLGDEKYEHINVYSMVSCD